MSEFHLQSDTFSHYLNQTKDMCDLTLLLYFSHCMHGGAMKPLKVSALSSCKSMPTN